MLKQRTISTTANKTPWTVVSRECPLTREVLSPVLWNMVVNILITKLNNEHLYTEGLLITRNYANTLQHYTSCTPDCHDGELGNVYKQK